VADHESAEKLRTDTGSPDASVKDRPSIYGHQGVA